MKEGLIYENGELVYYVKDCRKHAGAIQVDGAIYYIGAGGKAVKGKHIVHGEMANGILKRGTYTFGDDYKLVKGSYRMPKKHRSKKLQKFLKKIKPTKEIKILLGSLVAVLVLVCAYALIQSIWNPAAPPEANESNPAISEKALFVAPEFHGEILLCSDIAKQVYDHELDIAQAVGYGDPYRPLPFQYKLNADSAILLISEEASLHDAVQYTLSGSSSGISIDNLKTDTTYYYQVRVGSAVYPGSFRTAASTRFLSVPGLHNVRDIGGYQTMDGRTVRQGLLIRGVEFDGLVEPTFFIPIQNMQEVQDLFGFVYDFDLRASNVYSGTYVSRLGEHVGHKFYQSPQYGEIFTQNFQSQLREIFRDLADPGKYPMYLHCTYGTDRTGTIIFLLQGILNMSQQDMLTEYRLTGYANQWVFQNGNIEVIVEGLQSYEGDTLQEKIVAFLTQTVGVTQEEIDSIRSILLTD